MSKNADLMNEAIGADAQSPADQATLDDHRARHLDVLAAPAPAPGCHLAAPVACRLRLDVLRLAIDAAPTMGNGKRPDVILDLARQFHLFVTTYSSAPGSVGEA